MTKLRLLITLQLCCFAFVASTNTTTTDNPITSAPDAEPSSINEALSPLYSMTNGFLHLVFPSGIRVDTIHSLLDMVNDGSQIEAGSLIETFLNGYAGFTACVVIGLMLVVLMPLIGLICCCCRLCEKCGGKTQQSDPKHAKCKRILCAGLLFVFTVLTLGGMVMVFFSSTQLYNIVEDGTIDKQLQNRVQDFGNTAHNIVEKDVKKQANEILEAVAPVVNRYLDDTGSVLASNILGNMTNIEQPVTGLAKALDGVNKTLDNLLVSMQHFEDIRNETENNFTRAETLAQRTLISPVMQRLGNLTDLVDRLSIQGSINTLKTGVKARLKEIPNLREAYKKVNSTVSNVIQENFNSSKTDIQKTVSDGTDDARNQVEEFTTGIDETLGNVTSQSKIVTRYLEEAAPFAKYAWYACLGLGTIIALIILFYMCGLMFGCGERPGEDAAFCNKGCGARFLLSAVGFTFIFYALLMLLTTVLFFVGSLMSSQVCWTIQEPNSTLASFAKSDLKVPGTNVSFHSIVKAYSDCLDEQPIGDVVEGFDLGFDKASLTKLIEDQLGREKIHKAIDDINITATDLNFLPTNLNESLEDLKRFKDFNSSIIPNMTEYVEDIKRSLNLSIVAVNVAKLGTNNPQQIQALDEILEIFESSRDTGLDAMANAANKVTLDIMVIEDNQDNLQNASELAINAITGVQANISVDGPRIVKDVLRDQVDKLTAELKGDINNGIDKLFSVKCDTLAESLKGAANIVCDTVFNPWNALWFSLGWSLIALIPCLIIALVVVSLFRREQSYDGDYKEDLNRAYGRDIPLESPPRYHQNGRTNQAFKDDYAPHMSRAGGGERTTKFQGSRLNYY